MIQFSCPCGKQLVAEDQHAGKAVKYPQCGNTVNIPGANTGVQPPGGHPAPPQQQGGYSPPQQPSAQPQQYQATPPPQQQQPYPSQGGGQYGDYPPPRRGRSAEPTTNGMAVTSFVCGLLSFCIPFLGSLLAILFGFIGLGATGAGKQKGRGFAITGLILGFLTLVGYGVAGVYGYFAVQTAAARMTSVNNMKQIGLAMHAHHDANRTLPNHAIYGKDGKALLSWRVKILPYVEQGNLYKQFHLDEPWDSPHNKTLLSQMPFVYQNPRDPEANQKGYTHYQVIVTPPGQPQGIFVHSATHRQHIGAIMDGSSNTIMVVEADKAVPWTKPADIPYSGSGSIKSQLGKLYSGDGFNALVADGAVYYINAYKLDENQLRNLIMADDGNSVIIP